MRILVADDDVFFRKVIAEILEGGGHETVCASTGEEALEKALMERPDLIILDVILPGLLGTEVSRKLRGYSRTAAIPILLTSGTVAEIEAAGGDPKEFLADDFIRKPCRPDMLLDRVQRLVGSVSCFEAEGHGRPPVPAPKRERRQHPRLPIDVEVTAKTAEALLYHPMINISTGGIYVEVERRLPRGTAIELRFVVPETVGIVAAEGEVAWCLEVERGYRWGLGMRFTSIAPEALERIRKYVDTLLKVVRPNGVGQSSPDRPAGDRGEDDGN